MSLNGRLITAKKGRFCPLILGRKLSLSARGALGNVEQQSNPWLVVIVHFHGAKAPTKTSWPRRRHWLPTVTATSPRWSEGEAWGKKTLASGRGSQREMVICFPVFQALWTCFPIQFKLIFQFDLGPDYTWPDGVQPSRARALISCLK